MDVVISMLKMVHRDPHFSLITHQVTTVDSMTIWKYMSNTLL